MNDLSFLSLSLQKLCKTYIELDTSLPSGDNYPTAIKLLSIFLKDCNFTTETIDIPESVANGPNRQNLIAKRFVGSELPTLLIYSHIDVISAVYENAFNFAVKDGKIFGRGTADQKGGTIAVLSAFEQVKQQRLNYNIMFWATTDEETNQLAQLEYMSDKLDLSSNMVIIDPDTFAGGITVGNLGLAQLEITIHGKSAHSGMSHLGTNAIEQASFLITNFFDTEKKNAESIHSKLKTFPSLGDIPVCGRVNANMISGGSAPNVVPDSCVLTVDCRYIPEADVAAENKALIERLEKFAKSHYLNISIHVKQLIKGGECHHPLTTKFEEIYASISGEHGMYCAMGSTPLAHWAADQNLPHFGLGVIRGDSNIHGLNESAAINDIYQVAKTFARLFNE